MPVIPRQSAQVISSIADYSSIDHRPEYAFLGVVTASKGPISEPILCSTVDNLEATFGRPTVAHCELMSAYKIIEGGFPGYLVRVGGESLKSADVTVLDGAGNGVIEIFVKDKGTDGNAYTVQLSVEPEATDLFTLELMRGELTLDSVVLSISEADENYVFDYDHEILEFAPTEQELALPKSDIYRLTGGDDGIEDITAEDYIGASLPQGSTGLMCFLQTRYKAQFLPSLGYTDKAFLVACKTVADKRKDLTCIYDAPPGLTFSQVIDWRNSEGTFVDTPVLKGFNAELYWDWLEDSWDGVKVVVPPSTYVTLDSLNSWVTNGPWYPVAGDTRGKITGVLGVVTQLPEVTDRDTLVSNNINPIHDTGSRGIQIYGNETLNEIYSDLSAAHIARTLTYLRSAIDEYTETKKFELNDNILWSEWVDYVQDRILQPIKDARGLNWFRATMGTSTTSREELSQRKVRGRVELQFVPDAEIFILTYTVYASSDENPGS